MREKKGFTLVELLVAMALSILIGGVLYLLQSTGLSQVSKGAIQLTMQSEVRRKIERVVSDLRCANEVLEVAPGSIKVSQLKSSGEGDEAGTIEHFTVTYYADKDEDRTAFFRKEGNAQPVKLFTVDHIDNEIFYPFYQFKPDAKQDYPSFAPFNMHENDSGKREKISFIRIRMKLRQKKEFLSLATAVTLRPAHQRQIQPFWKTR